MKVKVRKEKNVTCTFRLQIFESISMDFCLNFSCPGIYNYAKANTFTHTYKQTHTHAHTHTHTHTSNDGGMAIGNMCIAMQISFKMCYADFS